MKKRSYHYFEIKGLNQERFFNELAKRFMLYEIDRSQKSRASFKVKYFDGKKVKKIILAEGFQILDEKRRGPFFVMSTLAKSYGIIAGIIVSVAAYFAQFGFVQKIDVWGDANVVQVKEFVKKSLPTRFKSNINTENIEKLIKNEFDELSFVSVAIIGQTLVVNVKQAIIPPEMEQTFPPIVSEYDGIVTQINLVQGTPLVQVGDIIQKGQILVEGKVTNSQGQTLNLQPRAEIFMDVWLEGVATHYNSQTLTQRTGKKIENSSVKLFGVEFYASHKPNVFDNFEEEKVDSSLSKNLILPFVVTKTTWFETVTQTIESTFEEKKDEIVAKARENCLQNVSKSDIIKNEDYLIVAGENFTKVRYIVTITKQVTKNNDR